MFGKYLENINFYFSEHTLWISFFSSVAQINAILVIIFLVKITFWVQPINESNQPKSRNNCGIKKFIANIQDSDIIRSKINMSRYQSIKLQIFYFFMILCYQQFNVETMILKFTKLECKLYDKSFGEFNKCYLKAIRRDTVALHLYLRLFKLPLNNISVSN